MLELCSRPGHGATEIVPPRPARSRPAAGTFRRRLAAVALTAVGALAAALPATEEIDRQAELEAIRDEITALRMRLARVQERRAGLADDLARIELDLRLQERRLAEARSERRLAEIAVLDTEIRVQQAADSLRRARRALRERLVDLYRLGRLGPIRLLFSIRSQEQLLPGIRVLRYLVHRHGRGVEVYLERRSRLGHERDNLVANRLEVERLLRREALRMEQLERARQRQAAVLTAVARERDTLATRTETLVDKERKLANLLDFLYGRTTEPLAGTPMQRFRGVLDWPARGKIVSGFGPRPDPRYGTRVPHNGIDIATGAGAEVRVVFPGRVVFAAPFQGYGLTAVVHHPQRVFSLYAGLRSLRVAADDMLSLGAVVGEAGETLYFEIRVENRPEDPVAWLR